MQDTYDQQWTQIFNTGLDGQVLNTTGMDQVKKKTLNSLLEKEWKKVTGTSTNTITLPGGHVKSSKSLIEETSENNSRLAYSVQVEYEVSSYVTSTQYRKYISWEMLLPILK